MCVLQVGAFASTLGPAWENKVRQAWMYGRVSECEVTPLWGMQGGREGGRPGGLGVGFGVVFWCDEGKEVVVSGEGEGISNEEKEEKEEGGEVREEERPEDDGREDDDEEVGLASKRKSGTHVNVGDDDATVSPPPAPPSPPKKKGLSAHDRKMIKKHGSLEAAAAAKASQPPPLPPKPPSSVSSSGSTSTLGDKFGQGKKKKEKKISKKKMKRYAEQDEEDRALAMMALQGKKGEAQEVEVKGKAEKVKEEEDMSGLEEHAASLSGLEIRKTTLDRLRSLTEEGRAMAVERLVELRKKENVVDSNASLSGVIRTVEKYGSAGGGEQVMEFKIEEDEGDGLCHWWGGEEELVGKNVRYARVVCGGWESLKHLKYRVMLLPDKACKRGKVAKQCVSVWSGADGKSREEELIQAMEFNDVAQRCLGGAKIEVKEGWGEGVKGGGNGAKGADRRWGEKGGGKGGKGGKGKGKGGAGGGAGKAKNKRKK